MLTLWTKQHLRSKRKHPAPFIQSQQKNLLLKVPIQNRKDSNLMIAKIYLRISMISRRLFILAKESSLLRTKTRTMLVLMPKARDSSSTLLHTSCFRHFRLSAMLAAVVHTSSTKGTWVTRINLKASKWISYSSWMKLLKPYLSTTLSSSCLCRTSFSACSQPKSKNDPYFH